MRCLRCQGTGFYLGMGMMRQDCDCDDIQPKKPVKIDKRSRAYKESIEKLKLTQDLTHDEAEEVFLAEFEKISS